MPCPVCARSPIFVTVKIGSARAARWGGSNYGHVSMKTAPNRIICHSSRCSGLLACGAADGSSGCTYRASMKRWTTDDSMVLPGFLVYAALSPVIQSPTYLPSFKERSHGLYTLEFNAKVKVSCYLSIG